MMTPPQQRETVVNLVDEAVAAGARRSPACQVVGITVRTLQRWRAPGEPPVRVDQRPPAKRPEPPNKLSEPERQALPALPNRAETGGCRPLYCQRIHLLPYLESPQPIAHAKAPQKQREPVTATAPNQVWTWV